MYSLLELHNLLLSGRLVFKLCTQSLRKFEFITEVLNILSLSCPSEQKKDRPL
jgi:hypothetical protein